MHPDGQAETDKHQRGSTRQETGSTGAGQEVTQLPIWEGTESTGEKGRGPRYCVCALGMGVCVCVLGMGVCV